MVAINGSSDAIATADAQIELKEPTTDAESEAKDDPREEESFLRQMVLDTQKEVKSLVDELYNECLPSYSVLEVYEKSRSVGLGDVNDDGRGWEARRWSKIEGYSSLGAFRANCVHFASKLLHWFYVPHLPAFHKPGWLLKHVTRPFDGKWLGNIQADMLAGFTVAMTLIPQGLSYATLANQPPINGLYSSVLPCLTYALFGSSMCLAVGPVAIVAMLLGGLVSKYDIEIASEDAVNFGQQICFLMGLLLVLMSVLNLGNFIRFISHPVMSGFTTAAAMLIGLNQIKSAFGFQTASGYYPQVGDGRIHYNYQVFNWLAEHFNDVYTEADGTAFAPVVGRSVRNPYAMALCFGIYIPLIFNQTCKNRIKPTPRRKNSLAYRIWINLSNLVALFSIIIGATVAYNIKKGSYDANNNAANEWYAANLKIVGHVPAGLDSIIRVPRFKLNMWKLLPDTLPITLIAFMESYSIAKKLATMRKEGNEMALLSPSQELFAIGSSNLAGAIASSFPVAGSYSRSSINYSAGGKTPLSKLVTLLVVVLALQVLTESFRYIPFAVLAAVIWGGVSNLIDLRDFWNCFKYAKRDFFTMMVTFLITLLFETSYGLIVGLFTSILVHLAEVAFSKHTAPFVVSSSERNRGVDVVRLEGDMMFLTAHRVKDLLASRIVGAATGSSSSSSKCNKDETNIPLRDSKAVSTDINNASEADSSPSSTSAIASERSLRHRMSEASGFASSTDADALIAAKKQRKLPKAIILDFTQVRIMDITGLHSIAEFCSDSRGHGILVAIVNTSRAVTAMMLKFGITSDGSNDKVNIDEYTLVGYGTGADIEGGIGGDDSYDEAEIENSETKPLRRNSGSYGSYIPSTPSRLSKSEKGSDRSDKQVQANPGALESGSSNDADVAMEAGLLEQDSRGRGRDRARSRKAGRSSSPGEGVHARTHREKYGIVDGAQLPITPHTSKLERSQSEDSTSEQGASFVGHGLRYDHNA